MEAGLGQRIPIGERQRCSARGGRATAPSPALATSEPGLSGDLPPLGIPALQPLQPLQLSEPLQPLQLLQLLQPLQLMALGWRRSAEETDLRFPKKKKFVGCASGESCRCLFLTPSPLHGMG